MKLKKRQWEEIELRFSGGESSRSLSAEFGVPESTIRYRTAQHKQIKQAALQLVAAEKNLKELPRVAQVVAQDLAAQLLAISLNLGSAAHNGTRVAKKLFELAYRQSEMVEGVEVDENGNSVMSINPEPLQMVSALSRVANTASEIGITLLRANKDVPENNNDSAAQAISDLIARLS